MIRDLRWELLCLAVRQPGAQSRELYDKPQPKQGAGGSNQRASHVWQLRQAGLLHPVDSDWRGCMRATSKGATLVYEGNPNAVVERCKDVTRRRGAA